MKRLFTSILTLAILAGCDDGKDAVQPLNNGEQEIQLFAGITKMEVTSKAVITGTTFENGTTIGLYAIEQPTQGDIWTGSAEYTNDGTATITDSKISVKDKNNADKKFYYPANNQPIQFFACYPVGNPATYTSGTAPTVTFDLTAEDKPDIMYATATSGTLSNVSAVELNFKHKLAKIGFKVKAGTNFPKTGITVTQVKISGLNTKATLDMGTGMVTYEAETPAKDIAYSSLNEAIGETATANAFGITLLEPGATYTLTVTAGNIDYTLTGLIAPAEGKAQNIVLTFNATEMDATTAITKWDELNDQETPISKQ